ncbi:MAG: DUF4388 domain-containing protein [Deltaproteobacteria bacterium]|nr:MAG: DUF4388 domain-containing protein [Deltaproteobacteria bacterium]
MSRQGRERRRGARISASLALRISGVDREPRLRRGDISSTGVYVEGDAAAGGCGTIEVLQILVPGSEERIEVLGRVVRRVLVEDLSRGTTVVGVAFEFLFTDDDTRARVAELVRAAAEDELDSGRMFQVRNAFDAQVGRANEGARHDATVYVVGVDTLSLETAWPVPPGEAIECVVRSPRSQREFAFTGKVVDSRPVGAGADLHRVDIRFRPDPDESPATIEDAIAVLIDESIHPESYQRDGDARADMRGRTDKVALASILSLAESERLSGVLRVRSDAGTGEVYLRDGRVVDVALALGSAAPSPATAPIDALLEIVQWPAAEFAFRAGAVDRDDRVATKTWALLLELARRRDEGGGAA